MPWPNIAVGMVIEYVHQSSVNGQALFYTNHYQVTNIGGTAPGIDTAMTELHTQFEIATKLNQRLAMAYGTNVLSGTAVSLQVIYPLRYRKFTIASAWAVGTGPSDCNAQNISVPLIVSAFVARPGQMGVKRIGGVPDAVINAGFVDPAQRGQYVDVGTETIAAKATATGVIVYAAVLFNRTTHNTIDLTAQSSLWKLGTMRRRTVGRGI